MQNQKQRSKGRRYSFIVLFPVIFLFLGSYLMAQKQDDKEKTTKAAAHVEAKKNGNTAARSAI